MYVIELADGTRINGKQMDWHQLPSDVQIRSLGSELFVPGDAQTPATVITDDTFVGFSAYGFQMYQVHSAEGGEFIGRGLQFLCVDDDADKYMLVVINLVTGERRTSLHHMSEMTYNRSLLRRGC